MDSASTTGHEDVGDPTPLLSPLPACLEMKSTPDYGRGLYARQLIQHGSVLLTATPLAHVVKVESRRSVCQGCLGKFMKLLRCGGCKYIHYCSVACQKVDWTLHKVECSGIQRVKAGVQGVNEPTDTMRLVVRLITVAATSQLKKQELDSLVSKTEDEKMSDSTKADVAMQVMGVALLLGNKESDDAEGGGGAADIFKVVGKVMCNTFNILDRDYDQVLGLGVYPAPSLVNHSCDPNCVVLFNGKQLVLRSVLPINPAEQVFVSYCEIMDSRSRRQAHLQKVYSFTCSCMRCQTEESESSPLHVMYAAKDGSVSKERRCRAMEEGFSFLDKDLKQLEKNDDWPGFVEKCCEFIGRLGGILHPLNVVLTNILEQQMRGQLALEHWEDAVGTGQLLTQAYNYCLPPFHPVHILHLVKMGKLRRVIGTNYQLHKSVSELQKALDRIPVTFGRDSALMKEVMLMLKDSQLEIENRT